MGKGSKKPEVDEAQAQVARNAEFKPYSLSSNVGNTEWDKRTNTFSSELRTDLTDLQDTGFGGAGDLAGQIGDSFSREAAEFRFDRDLEGRSSDIFGQQSALLAPAFAQQNQQLQNDLFGSGRMGLMMASDSAGAAGGGYVNPDAFGLSQAQSQTLANLAVNSRQQALGEQQQAYGIDSGMFGINQGMQQQRSNNLLTGASGLFGFGSSVNDIENQLMSLGLTAEQARGTASAQASGAMTNAQQAANQAQQIANQPSFLETLTIAVAGGAAEGASSGGGGA